MRRGADELHAARVGLLVGLAALERRQKRMVDVDDAVRKPLDELSAENLHVAGEHHHIDALLLQQLTLGVLLRALGLGRDGKDAEGHVEIVGHALQSIVIADDEGDVCTGGELTFNLETGEVTSR